MSLQRSLVRFALLTTIFIVTPWSPGCSQSGPETAAVKVTDAETIRPTSENASPALPSEAEVKTESQPIAPASAEREPSITVATAPADSPAAEKPVADPADAATSPTVTESRLDRARCVIETEGLIAKAVYEISQGTPTETEAGLLKDIAAKENVYRLLAADITNDAENLATAGPIMPWELRTRDVERNLLLGRSPFRRRVGSGSLALAQRIGDEQLESVRRVIDESKQALLASRMRRAWSAMTAQEQVLCEKYQPEFAAEASGHNDNELARLDAEIKSAPVPASLIARGKLHAARGNLQQALADLSQALLSPVDDEDSIRLLHANIAVELGNVNAAVRDYQQVAAKQGPLSDRALVAWGKLLAQRVPAQAMDKAEEALKINDQCAAAHALLADIHKSMNLRQTTIEDLQNAARLAPEDPTHFYRLGNLQAGLNATEEAVNAYTQAIAADPTWWRPYAGRATLHFRRRDLSAALQDLQDASQWAPRETSIYESRAVVLETMGRTDEAGRDRAKVKVLVAGGIP